MPIHHATWALSISNRLLSVAVCLVLAACGSAESSPDLEQLPPGAQAVSLLGDTLYPSALSDDRRILDEERLAAAQEDYRAEPESADALIWLGRRIAYLGDYREAIATYTRGITEHPDDPRMYRHRGHRYVSIRRFDLAIRDLERGAEMIRGTEDRVEPDGQPNARNTPTSTLHFNIWYHLGLAYYLTGDLENALRAYRECLAVSTNPDAIVASSYWLYMIFKNLGQDEDAVAMLNTIDADLDIIENQSYHRLLRLNKGELSEEDLLDTSAEDDVPLSNATVGYGVGKWHLYNGRRDQAESAWRRVHAGTQWAAFGYIAAEAELARMAAR